MSPKLKAALERIQQVEAELERQGKLIHPSRWADFDETYENLRWLFDDNSPKWITRIVNIAELERKRKFEFRR